MSPLTHLYLAFSQVSGPIWRRVLARRLKKGKELPERLPEKLGQYPQSRPEGEVIWCHALSVGESLALVPLIERALAEDPALTVVLTTSTATSVAALDRARLPERANHVLLPIDTAAACRAFLDHWCPSVAVFAELDFWPRLMIETDRRGIPMILINSRMSEANRRSRARLGGMMRDVLGLFRVLLLQDEASVERFVALGAPRERIRVLGALKSAARPLPAEDAALESVGRAIGARSVWLAAATERSEHAAVAEAARRVADRDPGALCLVAPRHVADGEALADLLRAEGLTVARRSADEAITSDVTAYVADTIGEMGLWYRVAPISFIGHSLPPKGVTLGGKNPYEAAALGSVILHGPAVSDFQETFDDLTAAGATRQVSSAEDLAEAVLALTTEEARRSYLEAAERVITEKRAILDETWAEIDRAR